MPAFNFEVGFAQRRLFAPWNLPLAQLRPASGRYRSRFRIITFFFGWNAFVLSAQGWHSLFGVV
jgi:hypothetical protein